MSYDYGYYNRNKFESTSMPHINIGGIDYLLMASHFVDNDGCKQLVVVNTADDTLNKIPITVPEINSSPGATDLYKLSEHISGHEFLMVSAGYAAFFTMTNAAAAEFSSATDIGAGEKKYIDEGNVIQTATDTLVTSSADYMHKIVLQEESALYFEPAYFQTRPNDTASERGVLIAPGGVSYWDPLKPVRFQKDASEMFPYKNKWGFFNIGYDLYLSYKIQDGDTGVFTHYVSKVTACENTQDNLLITLENEVPLYEEELDLNPRNVDYYEYETNKIMVTEDRIMLLGDNFSVIDTKPIHETLTHELQSKMKYKAWLRKGGFIESRYGLLWFNGPRESLHRIKITDNTIETQTYPLGFDIEAGGAKADTKLLSAEYFEVGEKSYLTLNKEFHGTYGIVELELFEAIEPIDYSSIINKLLQLKQAVIDLRTRINTELIGKAQVILSELADLNDNYVGAISTSATGADTLIAGDVSGLSAELATLETTINSIKPLMDAVLAKYSGAYESSAQEIIGIYDIQEEIKGYLVQAKNIINS